MDPLTKPDADVLEFDDVDVLEETDEESHLVVFNDDVNSFDYVIECFIDVLDHDTVQAEQLAMLIHFKGKATVMTAPFEVLHPYKDALCERGLSAVIEGQYA